MAGFVTKDAYDASFTPATVADFRAACREAAQSLLSRGVQPDDVAVESFVVERPRSTLGFKRKSSYQSEERVLLQGWELRQVRTLMGHSGDEWFQWTVSAALGIDGELYRVERHREERNGAPTADDGRVTVARLADRELPLFDVLEPERFRSTAPRVYANEFPRMLTSGLDRLLMSHGIG